MRHLGWKTNCDNKLRSNSRFEKRASCFVSAQIMKIIFFQGQTFQDDGKNVNIAFSFLLYSNACNHLLPVCHLLLFTLYDKTGISWISWHKAFKITDTISRSSCLSNKVSLAHIDTHFKHTWISHFLQI